MTRPILTIDLDAVVANWRGLDALSAPEVETAAVIKADAYGLGVDRVGPALAAAGVGSFFVALAEEGVALRRALGPGPAIFVFSGHMADDAETLIRHDLMPLLNAPEQAVRHLDALPDHPFGIQLDTGMNRLGFEPADFADMRNTLMVAGPKLVISHLACADEPEHPKNPEQLNVFKAMTDGLDVRRSLAATGGTLLGPAYHFDLCRPGVGLYGGMPYGAATPVVRVTAPVIQTREVLAGETVGYGVAWKADQSRTIATIAVGYADGLIRQMGNAAQVWAGETPCPLVGRVSMDMLTVDVTHLAETPQVLEVLGPRQTVDDLARAAGTIGYEILTSLGARYDRVYIGAGKAGQA